MFYWWMMSLQQGATVNEAAKILKKVGAGKVYIFTLGRLVVGKSLDRLLRKIDWYFREIKKYG
jgi:hypothetical protein